MLFPSEIGERTKWIIVTSRLMGVVSSRCFRKYAFTLALIRYTHCARMPVHCLTIIGPCTEKIDGTKLVLYKYPASNTDKTLGFHISFHIDSCWPPFTV